MIWAVIAGLLMVVIAFAFPAIRNALGIVPLTLQQWSWIAAIAIGLLFAVEIGKWVRHLLITRSNTPSSKYLLLDGPDGSSLKIEPLQTNF